MIRILTTLRSFSAAIICAAMLLTPVYADPQPNIPHIGVLFDDRNSAPWTEGLRDGLRQLGYVEGKSITIEWRGSGKSYEEMRLLAAGLARSGVKLIVPAGSPATPAALEITGLPVVFIFGDPVAAGFAASLAKPGGGGTGVSVLSVELYPKRLELLHELAPRARRIVFLRNPTNRLAPRLLDEVHAAGLSLGLQIKTLDACATPVKSARPSTRYGTAPPTR